MPTDCTLRALVAALQLLLPYHPAQPPATTITLECDPCRCPGPGSPAACYDMLARRERRSARELRKLQRLLSACGEPAPTPPPPDDDGVTDAD